MNRIKKIELPETNKNANEKNNFLNTPDKKEIEKIYEDLLSNIKSFLSKQDWINYIIPWFKEKYPHLNNDQLIQKIIETSEKNEFIKLAIQARVISILSLEKTINTPSNTRELKNITKSA